MQEPRIAGVPVVLLPERPVGLIDEDLYCMHCGYNLRGLSGDPVRCPECGVFNERGELVVPASMIKQALRDMETAPSLAVACFVIILVCSIPAMFGLFMGLAVALPTIVVWYACLKWTAQIFERQRGWARILFDFHLSMVLFTAIVPLAIVTASVRRVPGWAPIPVAVVLFLIGMRIYRRAQAHLALSQREAAVHIGQKMTRRSMRRRR